MLNLRVSNHFPPAPPVNVLGAGALNLPGLGDGCGVTPVGRCLY